MTHRILVVDDDDDVRRLAVMALSRVGGHEVTSAASGAECLAALEADLPDVVVLDVMMPGMDGPTTLQAIRDNDATRTLPVVFLTAGVVDADVDRLRSLQVTGILNKPFDPMQLSDQLAEILGW
jgi:CheY-like chemotaxis protein